MEGGFRAGCREQAGLAMHALGRLLASYGRTGNGRVAFRMGCLFIAPLLTLFVWMVQAILWFIVAVPILAYALLMAAIGGGFHRGRAATPETWHAGYQHVFGDVDPTYTEPHTPN